MFLNQRQHYSTWVKRQYHQRFKHRRKGEQEAAATQLGLWSGLMVAMVSVGFSAVGTWNILEQQSYNLLHQAKRELVGAPTWNKNVVVIAIDETSVEAFGRFPWHRDIYGSLLDQLNASQPAAIAFDILFPESTPLDAHFTQAINNSGNVVLAVGTDHQNNPLDVTDSIATGAQGSFLRGDASNPLDDDGISRQIQLRSDQYPSLSVATLQVYAETLASTAQALPSHSPALPSTPRIKPESKPDLENSLDSEHLFDPFIPPFIPQSETIWLNWPGEVPNRYEASEPGALKVYSYIDVVEGRVDNTAFQNKIVLVGSTLAGLDPLRTPFQKDPPVSGVYLYAATIDNLLNQSYLRRPPAWQTILLLSVLAVVGSRLLRHQGVYRRLAAVVCFPLGWAALALGSFSMGWWIPVAAPIGTVILSAIAVQLHEQQEKQQLMALFAMNVSPGTAELIWRHKGEILDQGELAAQTLTATVLFMDIRGFTSIAEALPSQQLLPWLNQYFETMTDCIMNHGGMVDKYIGDAIMAVFGAPVPRTDPAEIKADAIAAVKASIEMHARLDALNQQLIEQNLPTIQFGIGIHTGPLIGGTVGNRHRLNYSLFGDTVNIAARLEAMTKTLPEAAKFNLLLSADTYDYAGANLPVQLFRSTRLRGRTGSTDIYTVTGKMVQPCRRWTERVVPVRALQAVPQPLTPAVDTAAKAS